jgi:chromate transport protein ChrA
MPLAGPGISYLLLVIPTLFAVVVVIQGIYKTAKDQSDGPMVMGFGVVFLAIIAAAYWFFIR